MHGLIFQGGQINQKSLPVLLAEELRNMLAILDNVLKIFENLKAILPLYQNDASLPVGLSTTAAVFASVAWFLPDSCPMTCAAVLTFPEDVDDGDCEHLDIKGEDEGPLPSNNFNYYKETLLVVKARECRN